MINQLRAREIDEHAAAGHTQGIPAHNEEALTKAGLARVRALFEGAFTTCPITGEKKASK